MLEFNWKNVDSSVIGSEHGIDVKKEFECYKDKVKEIVSDIYANKSTSGRWLAWMNLGYNIDLVNEINEYAASIRGKFDNLVVMGIGGSALGTIAVAEALLKPYWNLLDNEARNNFPRIFVLDNIDPDQINGLFDSIDLKKTIVNVITKSGNTAETMSQFMIIKDKMEKILGDTYKDNIVTTTDKEKGILRKIANEQGFKSFIVPDDVGGRFSVFSSVGLLPFAIIGINIAELLRGVRELDQQLSNPDIYQNIAAQGALVQYLMDKKGKNLSVMMPYSSRLRFVSDWYVQLWAESLGKEKDVNGNIINAGPTPVKALGATDQHSQIQLYNEGPNDKIISFIRVKNFDTELKIPNVYEDTDLAYLCGKSINDLMNAEADATKAALVDYKRPTVTLAIDKVDEYNLAQLLYMLEVQTAIAGGLYNIDAFNQPGVEQAKNYINALMGKKGFEKIAEELSKKMSEV